jgi:hypothetical protein
MACFCVVIIIVLTSSSHVCVFCLILLFILNMECGFYVACMATSIVCVCPCYNCLSYTIILFSSVEYTDVSAYRLSLSEDTKALNQLVCGFCFSFCLDFFFCKHKNYIIILFVLVFLFGVIAFFFITLSV